MSEALALLYNRPTIQIILSASIIIKIFYSLIETYHKLCLRTIIKFYPNMNNKFATKLSEN